MGWKHQLESLSNVDMCCFFLRLEMFSSFNFVQAYFHGRTCFLDFFRWDMKICVVYANDVVLHGPFGFPFRLYDGSRGCRLTGAIVWCGWIIGLLRGGSKGRGGSLIFPKVPQSSLGILRVPQYRCGAFGGLNSARYFFSHGFSHKNNANILWSDIFPQDIQESKNMCMVMYQYIYILNYLINVYFTAHFFKAMFHAGIGLLHSCWALAKTTCSLPRLIHGVGMGLPSLWGRSENGNCFGDQFLRNLGIFWINSISR